MSQTRGIRWLVSILACMHLFAVFAEPFRFFSQSAVKPASEEAGLLRSTLAPYVEFMYLSHGYAFFAPNPGPSHLLHCKRKPSATEALPPLDPSSRRADEVEAKETLRVFPDRNVDRPRLLYHRYFMLSEFYQTLFAPAKLSETDLQEPGLRERWEFDRRLYEQLQASIRQRLVETYKAEDIELRRVEHALPSRQQILGDGWKLTDPRLYLELSEGDSQP